MGQIKIKAGEEFLGIGLIGPLKQSPSGEFEVRAGKELVKESIKAILSTESRFQGLGFFVAPERFMRDDFGVVSKPLKHESLDDEFIALVESRYIEAVERWEPRAVIVNAETTLFEERNASETRLEYELVGTNVRDNLVVIRNAQGKIIFRPEI